MSRTAEWFVMQFLGLSRYSLGGVVGFTLLQASQFVRSPVL